MGATLHRRRVAPALVTVLAAAVLAIPAAPPAGAYPGAPWFRPSVPYTDNFPDPSIVRVGNTYYAYATNTGGAYLPVMTSTDLNTWTPRPAYDPGVPGIADPFFNDALPVAPRWAANRPGATGRLTSEIWAPGAAVIGGRTVVFLTVLASANPERYCISVANSASPLGPFVDDSSAPLVCDADPKGSIDPQPFVDADGTPWLLWKSEGIPGSMPTRVWSRRLAPSGTSFAPGSAPVELLRTSQAWEGAVIENPAMVRVGGRYLLWYSGNEWRSGDYATGAAWCAGPAGPCTKLDQNPLLRSDDVPGRLGPGGPAPVVDAQGGLRLGYHWWNAPYTAYPAFPRCQASSTCATQGQRRLAIASVEVVGDTVVVDGRASQPAAPSAPSRFQPLTPARLLDTREGLGAPPGRVGAGGTVELQVAGRGGVPASGASAVVLNVTATDTAAAGFVTVWPGGTARPNASNLNLERPGQTIANLVTVGVGGDGRVRLFASGGAHLVADVLGYYTPAPRASAGRFQPVEPARLLDTRSGLGTPDATPRRVAADGSVRLVVAGRGGVPASGAGAAVLNVTATDAAGAGFVTVWPGGTARPNASNLNLERPGQTLANQVVVPIGPAGDVQLYAFAGAHLVVDVAGWFTDAGGASSSSGLFVSLPPSRLLDTRLGSPKPAAGTTTPVPVAGRAGAPSAVSGATLNVTVTEADGGGYVTVHPPGRAVPLASNVNVDRPGQTVPNHVTVPTAGGAAALFTFAGAHLIVDLTGVYTA